MKDLLKYFFLGLALTIVAGSSARADDWRRHQDPPPPPNCNVAPEVDPSFALGGLTLLGGTLTVLRSRRRSQAR